MGACKISSSHLAVFWVFKRENAAVVVEAAARAMPLLYLVNYRGIGKKFVIIRREQIAIALNNTFAHMHINNK